MTSEPILVSSEINKDYFERISKKYCPTVFEEISKYHPKTVKEPPEELVAFRRKSKKEKREDGEKFYRQDSINEYLEHKWECEGYNKDGFIRLHELHTQSEDLTEKAAISNKMEQFKNAIEETDNPYKALRINFSDYGMKSIKKNYQDVVNELNEEGEWE